MRLNLSQRHIPSLSTVKAQFLEGEDNDLAGTNPYCSDANKSYIASPWRYGETFQKRPRASVCAGRLRRATPGNVYMDGGAGGNWAREVVAITKFALIGQFGMRIAGR